MSIHSLSNVEKNDQVRPEAKLTVASSSVIVENTMQTHSPGINTNFGSNLTVRDKEIQKISGTPLAANPLKQKPLKNTLVQSGSNVMGSSSGNPSYNSGGPAGTYNSEKENSGHSSTEA
jgi:hypothetical protein